MDYFDIVFDGGPDHESGRFVEVEDSKGQSIKIGEWVHREDGYWALRIPLPLQKDQPLARIALALGDISESLHVIHEKMP